MPERNDRPFDPTTSPPQAGADRHVPQEHTDAGRRRDFDVTNWSQLGRRVLAEAWQRTTDAVATRRASTATPAVPAPHTDEAQ